MLKPMGLASYFAPRLLAADLRQTWVLPFTRQPIRLSAGGDGMS